MPVGEFTWHKTWQPVTLDQWRTDAPPGDRFTTVMTWQIESFADVGGNKDQEFVRYIDLPSRTAQPFELAINGPQALLREHGWSTVDAMSVSRSLWDYREFIQRSKAEFGVAKHTYVSTPLRMVQRPHRVLSRVGTAGARAGHRLDAPTCRPARACSRSRPRKRRSPASTRINGDYPRHARRARRDRRASTSTPAAC